jgi:AdoMet-dependent rRNA methyltransferase SPB1
MAKKTKKAKNRLDKYYYLAKEHNYRSRAAFKLIQLNAKHHFLESANILLDLCAAPGGWCQVASKLMPIESTIIGVDLDPIKPIPNVTTYQADITTERCRTLIQNQIKHLKVDVVLNDGAPNVGGQWSKDSFSQTELVLYAVKLATEFLKKGGWFVTKVFRSGDYNSLMYVFRQLFGNVVANKPLASRAQAAEIFVVCSNYKAPAHIDAKLLDPKYALKQLEEEDEMKSNAIKSIKAMFDKKKHRSGYNTESFYNKRTFKEFIECANPYQFLIDNNKIEIKTDDCKEYVKVCKAPSEYEFYFEDLQLLGKKEIQELIIWRNRIRTKSQAKLKEMMNEQQQHGKEEEIHDDNESGNEQHIKEKEEDDDVEEEMDEEIRQYEKMKKKKENREKRLQEKNELTQKKKYIEQEEQEQVQDNDVEFEEGVFDYIRKHKLNIEDFGKEDDDDNDNKEEEKEGNEDELGKYEEMNLSDLDEDDLIDMMNEDIEENKRLYEEEKGKSVLKKKNKNKKEVDGIQLVEQEKEDDLSDSDKADNEYDNEESEQGDDSDYYDNDNEDDNDNDIDIDENEANTNDDKNDNDNDNNDITITNPLRKAKKEKQQTQQQQQPTTTPANKSEDENALSSDTDEETKQPKNKPNKTKETFLNKKTQRTPKEQNDVESNSEGKDTSSDEDDGYNTDEKAEIRAIAKKMLRKKERLNILKSTYNRYAFNEEDRAPKWFIDDEKQHNVPNKPVTKAEILAERAYLKKITDRMPKKVLEAKARKRNKLNKRLEKVKKKAEAIANQEEINEFSKVKQIEKLYRKELSKGKEKKKYIISRAHTGNNRGKDGRNIKHVDRRLKKDKRAEKSRERRNKKYKRRR